MNQLAPTNWNAMPPPPRAIRSSARTEAMHLSHALVVALMTLVASSASAQDRAPAAFVPDVVKKVILDPTTYVPALLGWETTRLDWRSSRIFFQNGWFEHNARFTISGRSDDTAIGHAAGNRQILTDSLVILQLSLLHNTSERVIERLLTSRYPNHRKLLRAIGWIERSAVASYWTHRVSAGHFRQWRDNERLARQLGYR
ncbi:MAG: hypothetical protein A3H97_14300 [Acidobacteria bacterium RIFCSPLOWO2_02_FULL_65_29]|nr:MAG: hypothetical protein A3H97_14300 [Acidobacteria bacterium RIFCSPLOWO2_02_FULL_65_29]